MIATWMLSAIVFSIFVATAAQGADVVLRSMRRPTRWVWAFAIAVVAGWPVVAPFIPRATPDNAVAQTISATVLSVNVAPTATEGDARWAFVSAGNIVIACWALLSAMLLIRLAVSLARLRCIRLASRVTHVDDTEVLVHEAAGPAVIGIVDQRVVVPERLLDLDATLRAMVLRHETEHRRAHDPRLVFAAAIAKSLMPWNAVLWWMERRIRLAIEMDCDARVLATHPNPAQYGRLLVLISQWQQSPALAAMLAESTSHLERRVSAMLPTNDRNRRVRTSVALAVAVLAVIGACTSHIGDGITTPGTVAKHQAGDSLRPYFEFQVAPTAKHVEGTGRPRYPDVLRTANVEGEVLAQFVVDTDGTVVPGSVKMFRSTHELFSESVRAALPNARFVPAEVDGRKVRQLQQESFTFSLSGKRDSVRSTGVGRASASSDVIRFPSRGMIDSARAIVGGTRRDAAATPGDSTTPYYEFQVHRAAKQIPGTSHLRYPDVLRAANVEGEVIAQFVVDTDGTVLPETLKILRSTHELFTNSVKLGLPALRFEPAMLGGKKVREMMQEPFTFTLSKE